MATFTGAVVGFFVVIATVTLSDATIEIPFKYDNLDSQSELRVMCKLQNEAFDGWYNMSGNTKIQVVSGITPLADQASVLITDFPGKTSKVYLLVFPKGTQKEAGGEYECRGVTNKAIFQLFVPFSLAGLKIYQQIHLGIADMIVLGAHAYPKPIFIWKKNGQPFNPNTGRFTLQEDGSIVISKVEKSDAGGYDCNINWQNRKLADPKINVTVVQKPKFVTAPYPSKGVVGVVGYNFTFCCNATGIPKPTITWSKQVGVAVVTIDTINVRFQVAKGCLIIKSLRSSDVAIYKCLAKNTAGEMTASAEVIKVSEPPVITSSFKDEVKPVGDNFNAICSATGAAPLTVEWKRDGKTYLNQKKSPGQSIIKLEGLKLEDAATFLCSAKNGLQFNNREIIATKSFKLSIKSKPVINVKASETPVYSFVGHQTAVHIRCQFYGFPYPSVIMKKGGVTVANGTTFAEMYLKTTKVGDFGNFECMATNIHGQSNNTIILKQAVAPGKPLKVKAEKTCRDITLSWEPPADNGGMHIQHYRVTAMKASKVIFDENADAKKRSKVITNSKIKPETSYKVSIIARNKAAAGDAESLNVTTNKYCVPSPPQITNQDLVAKGSKFIVTWTAPKDNGYDDKIRYRVEWTRTSSPASGIEKSIELEHNKYIISGLKNGKHKLQLFAINRAGESAPDTRVLTVKDSEVTSTQRATFVTESPTTLLIRKIRNTTKPTEEPPQVGARTGGMSKGAIAGLVIAVLLIVLITIDLFCCFFNSCGLIFCCQKACFGQEKYAEDGKKSSAELKQLKSDDPAPENV